VSASSSQSALGEEGGAGEGGRGAGAYSDGLAEVDAEVDEATGAFALALPVPPDAVRGDAYIEVSVRGRDSGTEVLAGASIVIAEPRPPTVELRLDALPAEGDEDGAAGGAEPRFTTFVDGVAPRVRVTTATYMGAPVAGASLTLHWKVVAGGALAGDAGEAEAHARAPGAAWHLGLGALRALAQPAQEPQAAGNPEAAPPTAGSLNVQTGLDGTGVVALDADTAP